MSAAPRRLLLGPQRPTLNLGEAVRALGLPEGPLAVISAGWQEAEGDIGDVGEVVGWPLEDLKLYGRAESVFGDDPELADAHRERQRALRELQRLYRLRLKSLASAARQLLDADGDAEILAAEQRHAFAQLRALDRHHEHNTEKLHSTFSQQFDPRSRSSLAAHRREIEAILERSAGVLITGGNVIVLMNRMRLFDVAPLVAGRDVVGWSAGAMALAKRIVLYHDRMPLERRTAELFGAGLGLTPGLVMLPDPERRLRTRDALRMSLLSRRFSPDTCITLGSGTALTVSGEKVIAVDGVDRLTRNGGLAPVSVA
jgi:hypothetical protein